MIAKQITDNSFFLNDGEKTVGILIKNDTRFLWLSGTEKKDYESLKTLEKEIGKIHWDKVDFEQNKSTTINDYPCRHNNPVTIEFDDIPELKGFPLYNTGGNVIYSAGYWVLESQSSKRYGVSYCPKIDTLLQGKYYGPFKNRIEALQEANLQNKRLERNYESE